MAIWYRVKVSGSEFEDERVEDVQASSGDEWGKICCIGRDS
jgi:hypothetical protein